MSNYKPYRILQKVIIVVDDSDDMRMCYPHGKVAGKTKSTRKVAIAYNPGVINAPTEEEKKFFDLAHVAKSAKPIPQDSRGFDVRASGLARGIKSSIKGREDGIIEMHERKSKIKAEKKPATDDKTKKGDDA